MKFLIAGLGSIGRRHFRNLLALGERDLVLYRTRRSTLPEAELAGFPVETELHAALAHRPDAVIVSNPTALHLEVAIPAARAGCALLLEKPVSHSLAGIDELCGAVQRSGAPLLVGFQFRFHPGLAGLRQALQAGSIGRPLSGRATYGEYLPGMHPWEDYRLGYGARQALGGGVALTLCHPLDYLPWLLGEVQASWSFSARLNDFEIDVEDTVELGLRFAGGAVGSVHLDYNRRPPEHALEVVGTQGTLAIHFAGQPGPTQLYDTAEIYRPQAGAWEALPYPPGAPLERPFERNDMFLAEMRHFLALLRGEAAPQCTLEDGLRALELALRAQAG